MQNSVVDIEDRLLQAYVSQRHPQDPVDMYHVMMEFMVKYSEKAEKIILKSGVTDVEQIKSMLGMEAPVEISPSTTPTMFMGKFKKLISKAS